MQKRYCLGAEERVMQKTALSFDVSVWEVFWPMMSGAGMVIAEPGGEKDRQYLIREVKEKGVTTMHFVPTMMEAYLEGEGAGESNKLRRVISSGEEMSKELKERFYEEMKGELHNLYGPTEAAIDVTSYECKREREERRVAIGRPISNVRIYIVDERMRIVPVGVAGELYIGGEGLARGYLNRADMTAERFVPDPYSEQGGERLYRTGDVARYRADAEIEYIGRIDNQVKVRGYRIELGEIEAALREHPEVRECAVMVREDQVGDKRLAAYLVFNAKGAVTSEELLKHLKKRLPEYMVPAIYVALERMPITPNGKLDRNTLMKIDVAQPRLTAFAPPRTELEQIIAGIWQETLRAEKVGIYDNYFDLGGHSYLMIKAHKKLEAALDREIQILDMFEHPTISSLAEYLGRAGEGSSEPKINNRDVTLREGRNRLRDQMNQRQQARKKLN
jgi:acyl-coenzyme A synthetase/AMP-(fatty) acid ligase